MVWGIIAAVIAVVASAGVYYQQKKMEAQAAKQAQEAKAVQVSGHDSNRGLYTVYGQTLVGSTIVWKTVTDKEARITQSGFTTISAATGSHLTTNKDHKNNRWLYRAVTLCNGPVTEITNVTIDDEGYRSPRFTNKTTKHFATTYSVGPTAGQNFSALRNAYASDFSTWASDAVGKGVAYAIERLYLHKDKPAYQGEPQTRYRVKGRALYDPRKDSTSSAYDSNLGTSSHRADTATTWEYSDNPVLALLDYMRSGEYGRGLDLSVIDIDSIAVSADKCDVLVDIPQRLANDTGSVVTYYDPETGEVYVVTVNGDYPYYRADQQTTGVNANKQRRFRINMAVDPSKEILDNIQEILNVFRGNLSYANGKYFVHMADVASPVLTLNDDDIIGGLKIANGDRSQRMNRATVKFINQAKQYKTDQVSWPSLDSNEDGGLYATYLTQDEDEKLHRTFTIKGCTDFYQAQDTAEFLVRDSRSNLSVSGTFGSRCFGLIPGDVVALDYDSSGFSGKYFRVIQTQVDLVSMNVGLQLKEYDSSVYTWNTSRGNEPLGLSWQEEVVNADPTNLTIGTIATNTTTRSDGSASQTLTIPFSDVPEAAQYVEIGVATNNTTEYETHLVFDTENQTQAEIPIARDNQTYAVRARYFATNSYGTLMPSAYTETTHAVASLSGTKLDGIATGATQNTGALADLDTVDTAQIDNDAITVAKLDTSLESTNYQTGVSGWKLTKAGVFEAGDGTFRGALTATSGSIATTVTIGGTAASTVTSGAASGATALQNGDDITDGTVGGITITSSSLYQGTGTWANSNTGFYLDNTGKFSLKDKLFFNPSNTKLTVAGNIEADTITVNDSLVVLGPLEAKSLAPGSITREMFSQDALDEIFGSLATSVGGSNGDYKENTGNFTASGGTVTLGTSSDKFDHGTSDVDVEFLVDHFFYTTTNYTTAQAQATLNFEVSADGTFTDLTSATKTHTLQFNEYDLSSYYGYTYLVYYLTGDVTKTFTSGSGNDIADNTDVQFRVRVTGVGTAFTGQTVPFTVEANEGVTGVVSTGGNADTLDNLDSTAFLRSNTNDTFDGDLTITGQLILNGSIDQYNVTDLDVSDKTITVNSGNTQSLSNGAGLIVDRGTAADASILWTETNDRFVITDGLTLENGKNLRVANTGSSDGRLDLANTTSSYDWLLYHQDSGSVILTVSGTGGGEFIFDADASDYTTATLAVGGAQISATKIGQWNTAYTYSQVGHLPLSGGTIAGNLTVNHSSSSGVNISATDVNANQEFYAEKITYNTSGGTTLTADRNHIGLYVDVNASATGGNTSNEHRVYGVYADVQSSGDSDLVYGVYGQARTNNFGSGQVTNVRGTYGLGIAHHNAATVVNTVGGYNYALNQTDGTGQANSIIGAYNHTYAGSTSSYTGSNYYGSWNIAQISGTQTANINSATGVYGEVQLDNATVAGHNVTIGSAYVFRANYDENDADDTHTVTNGYLFHGAYAGTRPTNAWGIYISADVDNYFAGSVRTGAAFKTANETVIDASRNAFFSRVDTDSSIRYLQATGTNIVFDDGTITFNGGAYTFNGSVTGTGRGTFDQLTLTGSTDNLTFNEVNGDWTINNAQQNNGITIYDGGSGVVINYNGSGVAQFDSGGGMDLLSGDLQLGGTSVIGSNRRITTSDGTTVKAAYGFTSDSTTGISKTAAGRVSFLSAGAVKAYIQTGSSNPISPVMYVDGRTEINGVVTWTGGSSTNANTAYGWGDHSTAGYPTVNSAGYNGIYNIPIETGGNLYVTPNAGAVTITGSTGQITTPSHGNSSQWNTAYGWGDHSTAGYLTSYTETDTLATVTGRGATTTNAISTGAITTSDRSTFDRFKVTSSETAASSSGINFTITDSVSNQSFTGVRIDHNASGSQAHTGDNAHYALFVDMDTTQTGGDTSNENRAYGIYSDVRGTGDTDLRYAVYGYSETQHSSGTVSENAGVYGFAVADDTSTGHTGTNIGGKFLAYGYNTGTGGTTNHYAVYGKVLLTSANDKNTNSATGVYGEIEIDTSGAATTLSNGYVFQAQFDQDASDVTVNNGYLFYGNYTGTLPTTAYGVYIADNVTNYFGGDVRTQTAFKIASETVIDASRNAFVNRIDTDSSIRYLAATDTNIVFDDGTITFNGGAYTFNGTISSGGITADTGGTTQFALDIGGSSATNYTVQRWLTSAHTGSEAYIIAYGAGHSSESGNFAIKNLEASSDIFFELAGSIKPLRLTSTGATFAGTISSGAITSSNQVQGSRLKINVPDSGGSPALTAYMDIYGYEGRGAGINIRDSANSASNSSTREWFIGSGYGQSGFNIGYSATGSQTSYSPQNKFSLDTSGNAVIAGTLSSGAITSSGKIVGTELEINSSADSDYLAGTASIATNGYIMANALLNEPETGTGATGITFGNGPTLGNDQISLITSGLRRIYINSTGVVNFGNGNLQGIGTVSSGAITSSAAVVSTAVDSGNPQAATDQARLSGYGLMGNRSNLYITNANASGIIQLGVGGAHNANPALTVSASNINAHGSTLTSGAITSTGTSSFAALNVNGYSVLTSGAAITTAGAITAGDSSSALGYYVGANQVIDGNRALKNIVSINSGDITITNAGMPTLTLYDNGNGGGGAAEAKIEFKNTAGTAIAIGYTDDQSGDSDLIISTNAAGTYGGYLGLGAAAIADTQSDIILEPKTDVRIATGGLKIGTTSVIDSSGKIGAGGTVNSSYALYAHGSIAQASGSIYSFGDIVIGQGGLKKGSTTLIDSSRNLTNIGEISSGNITMTGNQLKIISSTDSNLGWMVRDNTYVTDEMDITATRLGSGNQPTLGLAGQSGINFYVGGSNVGSFNSSGNLTGIGTISSGAITSTGNLTARTGTFTGQNGTALNVNSGTTNVAAKFESGDDEVWINLKDNNSGNYGALLGHADDALFKVADNNVNVRMLLSAAGLLDTDSGYSIGGTTVIDASRNGIFAGLYTSQYLYHAGDTNTYIRFTGDRIRLVSGGVEMIDCVEGATDYVDIVDRVRVTTGGNLECEGNITAYSTTSISDRRQKKNIEVITDPIEKIKAISGYTFDWKESGEHSGGVIAQEVENVMPSIIKETSIRDSETMKAVDYQAIIGLLVETVKDLNQRIEDLENGDN